MGYVSKPNPNTPKQEERPMFTCISPSLFSIALSDLLCSNDPQVTLTLTLTLTLSTLTLILTLTLTPTLGVTTRNIWHNVLAVVEHINRPRTAKVRLESLSPLSLSPLSLSPLSLSPSSLSLSLSLSIYF